MNRKIKHFLGKLRSEAGDTMSTLIIVSMPLLLFMVAMTIDFTKNGIVKSEYNNIAQEAAQSAVREQTGDGSLKCGQTPQYERSHASTPVYVIRGLNQARQVANGNWSSQGITQGSGINPDSDNAQAVTHFVRSYLEKTGRMTGGSSIYNNGELNQKNGEKNQNAVGSVASSNDAKFVKSMKEFINDPVYSQAENNTLGLQGASGTHTFYNMSNSDTSALKVEGYDSNIGATGLGGNDHTAYKMNDKDTFTIAIACSKALANSGREKSNTAVSNGNKYTTISVDVRDWSGNFALGMLYSDWNIQRFRMNPRATTSWSNSSIN